MPPPWPILRKLAAGGHYQVSRARGGRVVTAFAIQPDDWNVDGRTSLYVLQAEEQAREWWARYRRPEDPSDRREAPPV